MPLTPEGQDAMWSEAGQEMRWKLGFPAAGGEGPAYMVIASQPCRGNATLLISSGRGFLVGVLQPLPGQSL